MNSRQITESTADQLPTDTDQTRPLRIVIVGGVAGGASAAARARRVNATARIILFEKGPYVSFANCGLPYHIGGEIEDREDLLVTHPDLFRQRFGIEIHTQTEVLSINRDERHVVIRTPNGNEEAVPYDRLILSPGAQPIVPEFAAGQWVNVATLWSIADMDRIIESLRGVAQPRAVVIGGGFVGLEVVEQLVHRGVACTLIERNPQVLKTLDPEMAWPIASELREHGIDLQLTRTVHRIESTTNRDGIRRATGVVVGDASGDPASESVIPCDLVVMAIGIRPRTELAIAAELTLGPSGGIAVDGMMRTSDRNIFAVGDCIEVPHGLWNRPQRVPLAGPANRAGRIAGEAAAGGTPRAMRGVLGTSVVRVFRKTAASTGLTQSQCEAAGWPHRAIYIQAADHASYFPGAQSLTLKLIYEPGGKLLGAQGFGGNGVDKRIDIISTAISFGGTVWDLAGLDLAYAPPYGSAKDPVHMAAFVACNDLENAPRTLPPLADLGDYQVVDVRSEKERQTLPLPESIAIPINDLKDRLTELDPARPTVAVCHTGKRAHVAACWMAKSGFGEVYNLTGGMFVRTLMAESQT